MSESPQQGLGNQVNAAGQAGCLTYLALFFPFVWAIFLTVIYQTGLWSIEQAIFEGSLPVKDTRWIMAIGYSLALCVPFFIINWFSKSVYVKAIYRTIIWACIYSIFLFPWKLESITDQQSLQFFQIISMVVFLILFINWGNKNQILYSTEGKRTNIFVISLGFTAGAILVFPWIVWGALGSWLDTLLACIDGLMFGVCSSLVIQSGITHISQTRSNDYKFSNLFFDGLVASLVLLIMTSSFGQNGNEWILVLIIPIMGWGSVALNESASITSSKHKWIAGAVFIGLAASQPLLWLDADELNIVVGSGSGEVLNWAIITTIVTLVLNFFVNFIFLALFSWIIRNKLSGITSIFIGAGWIPLLVIAYLVWGRPGFYGDRLFVILKDQADVSKALQIPDNIERRNYVYRTLTQKAEQSQAGLRSSLNQFGISYQPFYLVNGLEITGGPLLRLWLKTRPEVDRVLDNPVLRPLPAPIPVSKGTASPPSDIPWNLSMINADQVWKLGITGKGIIVGQSDSGAQFDHPELISSYRGSGDHNDYSWYDPWYHSTRPTDTGGHGTHTLGLILGKNVGVAPGAFWIGCVNLARNLGNPAVYLDCWQFLLAPFPQNGNPLKDGKVDLGANIFNNSWGCPIVEGCDPNVYLPAVEALKDAGIFVVVSAGNEGYSGCGSVEDPPAIYKDVYSVGAVDSAGRLADFSSMGPVTVDGSWRLKPDILAPGENVLSSYPESTYEIESGTSMSGPEVAGVVALMWSANSKLIGNIDRTTEILNRTAIPYKGSLPSCISKKEVPNDATGYGLLDALSAVQMAIAYNPGH